MNQYDDLSEPDLTPEEKEAIRRAREAMNAPAPSTLQPANVPTRVAEMPLGPAPGGVPNFSESMANLLDPQGRRVLSIPENGAFSAQTAQGMRETQPAADTYMANLAAYNAQPRNEALFAQQPPAIGGQPSDVFGIPRGLTVGPDSSLVPMPGVMTPAEEDAYLASRGGGAAAPGQDPFFQPDAFMSAAEERMLAQRQLKDRARTARGMGPVTDPSAAAEAPSFADNEAALETISRGQNTPIGQTEPDEQGNTYPVVATLRDVLNREFRLVQVGAGNYQVFDPRTGEWAPFNPDDWTISGQRARRGG